MDYGVQLLKALIITTLPYIIIFAIDRKKTLLTKRGKSIIITDEEVEETINLIRISPFSS